MRRVAKVILSRQQHPRWRGLTSDQIVQQRAQFSGWERPDREQFIARQPPQVIQHAQQALVDAQQEMQVGGYYGDHYLTNDLYNSPRRPGWANKMRVVERHGRHTFLRER